MSSQKVQIPREAMALFDFVPKMARRGYPAAKLFVYVGESKQEIGVYSPLNDEVVIEIYQDAVKNAHGVSERRSRFWLSVIDEGDNFGPGCHFSVTVETDDVPDRYEPATAAKERLYLESIDKAYRQVASQAEKQAISQTMMLEKMTNFMESMTRPLVDSLGKLTQPVTQMAATYGDALGALRDAAAVNTDGQRGLIEAEGRAQMKMKFFEMLQAHLTGNTGAGGGGDLATVARQLEQLNKNLGAFQSMMGALPPPEAPAQLEAPQTNEEGGS